MADLVWSDPDQDKEEFAISPRCEPPSIPARRVLFELTASFTIAISSHRGAGYTFGSQVVRKFLSINGFDHMLRAHQLCMDGYSELFDKQLSTVWSAPNVRMFLLYLIPTIR